MKTTFLLQLRGLDKSKWQTQRGNWRYEKLERLNLPFHNLHFLSCSRSIYKLCWRISDGGNITKKNDRKTNTLSFLFQPRWYCCLLSKGNLSFDKITVHPLVCLSIGLWRELKLHTSEDGEPKSFPLAPVGAQLKAIRSGYFTCANTVSHRKRKLSIFSMKAESSEREREFMWCSTVTGSAVHRKKIKSRMIDTEGTCSETAGLRPWWDGDWSELSPTDNFDRLKDAD